eukprot:3796010-Prymnesium_polylepis.1
MLTRQYRCGRHRWRGRVGAVVTPGYLTPLSTRKVAVTRGGALIPLGADPPGKGRVGLDPG